jgi:hypothetical protein
MGVSAVGERVHQPRIAVKGEDDRFVGGEQRVELGVGDPVWMLGGRLQPHKVDDVHHPYLEVGQPSAK